LPWPVIDPDDVPTPDHGGRPPGKGAKRIQDLSLSTNPFGPPPFLREALAKARKEVGAYPDRKQLELTRRLEGALNLDPGEVLVAGSASELLRAAITAYGTGRTVLLPRFTYSEYERVALSVRAKVSHIPMPGLRPGVATISRMVTEHALVVLPNPGTPFADYLPPDAVEELVSAIEKKHAILVLDESYLPFVRGARSATRISPSVLVIFSWSKVLGTPGLPLGHAAGHPAVLTALKPHLLPWSVGPFARHLALSALSHERWVAESLGKVLDMEREVRGKTRASSLANYFVIESESGRALHDGLLERGYAVRDLTSMGLTRHVRFGIKSREVTLAFLREVADLAPDAVFL
jgi:histidinol-phosphate aminotransferase